MILPSRARSRALRMSGSKRKLVRRATARQRRTVLASRSELEDATRPDPLARPLDELEHVVRLRAVDVRVTVVLDRGPLRVLDDEVDREAELGEASEPATRVLADGL